MRVCCLGKLSKRRCDMIFKTTSYVCMQALVNPFVLVSEPKTSWPQPDVCWHACRAFESPRIRSVNPCITFKKNFAMMVTMTNSWGSPQRVDARAMLNCLFSPSDVDVWRDVSARGNYRRGKYWKEIWSSNRSISTPCAEDWIRQYTPQQIRKVHCRYKVRYHARPWNIIVSNGSETRLADTCPNRKEAILWGWLPKITCMHACAIGVQKQHNRNRACTTWSSTPHNEKYKVRLWRVHTSGTTY